MFCVGKLRGRGGNGSWRKVYSFVALLHVHLLEGLCLGRMLCPGCFMSTDACESHRLAQVLDGARFQKRKPELSQVVRHGTEGASFVYKNHV